MRKVKLQDTGEYSTSDVAYQAPNKKYYSNEAAYQKMVTNSTYRQKCIDGMYELLGYKDFMKIPTYFYKRLKECEGYGYDVVYRCIQIKAKDIKWALTNKEFNTEVGKMMYIWAILNNSMNDALREVVAERRENERAIRKESETCVNEDDLDIKDVKQRTVNISRFLED